MTWVCPKCERELLKENQTHYCARVSIDSLFKGKPAELVLVFDKLLAGVADWKDVPPLLAAALHTSVRMRLTDAILYRNL